jgi:peptidoglycan/LPS O-acetylase OafA/YrhL
MHFVAAGALKVSADPTLRGIGVGGGYTNIVAAPPRWPQLNGLRAIAVMMVIWSHTMPGETLGGVRLFFVLSGFLITGVLLRRRDRDESLGDVLWTFYTRRALRIFPAYFLLLLALIALDVPNVRADAWWYAGYLTNWLVTLRNAWPPATGHFWSLAVEEQFYLVWPFLILRTPRPALARALVVVIGVALVARSVLPFVTDSDIRIQVPTVVALDALGIGAVLALARHEGWSNLTTRVRQAGWLGVLLLVSVTLLGVTGRGFKVIVLVRPFALALLSLWAVDACVRGIGGPVGRFLSASWVGWVGMVSYGIYLYHLPIVWALHSRGWSLGPALFAATIAATFVAAALSWRYLERPLNDLKDRVARRSPSPLRRLRRSTELG